MDCAFPLALYRNILGRGVLALDLSQRRMINEGQLPVHQTLERAIDTLAGKPGQERFRSFRREFFPRQ